MVTESSEFRSGESHCGDLPDLGQIGGDLLIEYKSLSLEYAGYKALAEKSGTFFSLTFAIMDIFDACDEGGKADAAVTAASAAGGFVAGNIGCIFAIVSWSRGRSFLSALLEH